MEIKVLNLSKVVTEDELIDFFGFCGEIDRIKIVDSGNEDCNSAFILFRTSGGAKSSLFLTGSLIRERKIIVTQSNSNENNSKINFNDGINDDIVVDNIDGDGNEKEKKIPFGAFFEDVITTGQTLSRTVMEKLWEFDETYKISEYIKSLSSAVHDKYESSGAAEAMRTAGATIRDNTMQAWAEALRLLGGEISSERINYNTFEQI